MIGSKVQTNAKPLWIVDIIHAGSMHEHLSVLVCLFECKCVFLFF